MKELRDLQDLTMHDVQPIRNESIHDRKANPRYPQAVKDIAMIKDEEDPALPHATTTAAQARFRLLLPLCYFPA